MRQLCVRVGVLRDGTGQLGDYFFFNEIKKIKLCITTYHITTLKTNMIYLLVILILSKFLDFYVES